MNLEPFTLSGKRLQAFVLFASLIFACQHAQAQSPSPSYSNFVNNLFIPDTLSTWPLDSHSVIHLDVEYGSRVLFPNASEDNKAVPGFPFHEADTQPIRTISYTNSTINNPGILGPTLIWWYGDSVTMEVHNHLLHETTTHWHGAHVAPGNDGGPHQVIDHDATWSPSFKIRDDVSTMWYHPHLHHHTMEQVQRGMAGMIITKNANDPVADLLPHDYGVNDFPIIFQDKFVQYDPSWDRDTINWCCSLGTIPLVNGTWEPKLEVPNKGLIRFRILNGSSERTIALSLQRGSDPNALIPFDVIASDAGYLNHPYRMNEPGAVIPGDLSKVLIIMAGERYEIVFDAGLGGDSLFLVNRRDWMMGNNTYIGTFAGGPNYNNPSCYSGPYPTTRPDTLSEELMMHDPCASSNPGWMVPWANFDSIPMPLLKIVPRNDPDAPVVMTLPSTLANWQAPSPASASVIRTKNLLGFNTDPSVPPFSIDGINFNLQIINDYIQLGATEIWDVYNSSGVAHPFHVHDIHFFITDISSFDAAGNMTTIPVPPYMQGPKDVMPVASSTGNGPFTFNLFPQYRYRLIGTWNDFGVPLTTNSLFNDAYMYHCHILDHEDGGMMHQFVVISSNTNVGVDEAPGAPAWELFPNPTTGQLSVQAAYDQTTQIQLVSPNGALLRSWDLEPFTERTDIDLGTPPAGIYLMRWLRPDGVSTRRVMVMKP